MSAHHTIDYIEFSVHDLPGAKRFVREPYAFPGGRRFHFMDPSGNELGIWSDR